MGRRRRATKKPTFSHAQIEEIREAELVDDFVGALGLLAIPANRLRKALSPPAPMPDPAAEPRTVPPAETRTVAGETYTLKEQLNIDGNAEIWRVVDAHGDRYARARDLRQARTSPC